MPVDVLRTTGFVALAIGLLLGPPEFLREGGEVEPAPLPDAGLEEEADVDEEAVALIGIGGTAAAGLISCEG